MAQDLYSNLPPEIVLQQQGLNRQQEMAKALLAQGAQQNANPSGQMVSGRYVPNSFFQNLQGPVNLMLGAYLAKQGDTKAAELAKQLREGRSAAEEKIIQQMTGTPAQATELAGPYTNKVPMPVAVQPAVAPDLAGALREIRTNPYGAGKEYTPSILKQMMPEKPSDQLGYELAKSQGFPGSFWDYKTGLANATASRTSLNVQNQLPFKEQIQKEVATSLIKDFDVLKNVPATMQNMDKMVQLSKQPIYAGVGGETKLQFVKLLNNNLGTNISPEAVKNTEEFRSASYMGIMDNLKKTDSNPTVTQQNALKEAIGSLGTDPSAIPRVVNVMRDILENKAKQHNALVEQTMKKGIEYPYDIRVQLPQTTLTPSGNVRSLADEILNRKPQ